MSGAKHTPGQWRLDALTIIGDSGEGQHPVAFADGPTMAISDANATLIAAAPDLLAACEALLAGHVVGFTHAERVAAIAAARAAIAKAKGGDQ